VHRFARQPVRGIVPSYEQIRAETGINPDTIGRALEHLNSLAIDGQRVLLRYRIRDGKNRFVGGNRYIVFPTPEQLAQYETPVNPTEPSEQPKQVEQPDEPVQPNSEQPETDEKSHIRIFPNVENSELGKSVFKKNQSFKKIKNMGAAAPARPAPQKPSKPDPKAPVTVALQKRIAAFPADCQPGAKLLSEIFNLRPPEKPGVGEKGGDYALWINGLRELAKIAADYDTPLDLALRRTWQRWNQAPFNVSHPGALAKTMTSVLAQSNAGQNQISLPGLTALEQALKNFKPRS
jgi:hypothetical protein